MTADEQEFLSRFYTIVPLRLTRLRSGLIGIGGGFSRSAFFTALPEGEALTAALDLSIPAPAPARIASPALDLNLDIDLGDL
jgi:hypothetical protein